jgi:16S rRNA (cytosine1402-N4)-methyltransferase
MLPLPRTEVLTLGLDRPHEPVLLREVIDLLAPRPGSTVVDVTLGAGGHTEALLEAIGPDGRVVGIDRDPHALEIASARLASFGNAFRPLRGDHIDLLLLLKQAGIERVDAVLADLGLSSMQIDNPARGFSFREDGPLDMRMDPSSERTAAQIIAEAPEEELRRILWTYGEERKSVAIAKEIVRQRSRGPITRTRQLSELVERVQGERARRFRIHPATRTFQALRIAVNQEVEGLERLVEDAVSALRQGGRLAVIAYHSLEDRAVKRSMRRLSRRCQCPPDLPVCGCGRKDLVRILNTKPVRPSEAEIERNPRSRSARLRAVERV